jgi:large subunit ribosomal protein L3
MKGILGIKLGMTQIFQDDQVVPVTVVQVGPCHAVQRKTGEKDGYEAVQIALVDQRPSRKIGKALRGHFDKAGVAPGKRLVELRLDSVDGFEVGQEITVEALPAGTRVDVTATSRGKGFAGVMKRHNFKGQGASHGNHKNHRTPGSVGACSFPGRVFRGQRMPGHMGHEQVTTLNLEVVDSDVERNVLLIKGSVPGPNGGVVSVRNAVKAAVSTKGA